MAHRRIIGEPGVGGNQRRHILLYPGMRIIRKQIFAPPHATAGICDYFDAKGHKNQRAVQ